MEPITVHTGRAVALRRSNVDTDQIIPAVYLKRVTRTGFEDGLFAAWRSDPDFVLNRPERKAPPSWSPGRTSAPARPASTPCGHCRTTVSGSWSPRGSPTSSGGTPARAASLTACVSQPDVERLWDSLEADPATEVTVDLAARTVSWADQTVPFDIDDYTRWRLMEGLDDVDLTLLHADQVARYEADRPAWLPTTV